MGSVEAVNNVDVVFSPGCIATVIAKNGSINSVHGGHVVLLVKAEGNIGAPPGGFPFSGGGQYGEGGVIADSMSANIKGQSITYVVANRIGSEPLNLGPSIIATSGSIGMIVSGHEIYGPPSMIYAGTNIDSISAQEGIGTPVIFAGGNIGWVTTETNIVSSAIVAGGNIGSVRARAHLI